MLTADQFDGIANPIIALYETYNQSVINDIARRLKKMGKVTDTAIWQVQRLIESGAVYENALKEIARLTGISETTLANAFRDAGVKAMSFDDSIYTAAGLNPLPLNLSPAMASVLAAGLQKTRGLVQNLTMTTATNAKELFTSATDLAYLQVSSGAMSYDQAIRTAIKDVAAKGLSVIQYASGHRDQLDVAMRRAVLTGVGQTTGQLQITRADEMGSDLVQTSAHIGARNKGTGPANHESWQGRVFSRSGRDTEYPAFIEKTGYGTGEGLNGWNCVIGETLVSGPTACAAYRRKYSGEIVTIRTSSGNELTVTPNHPILTPQGWIAAGLLAKGDYIISRAVCNGVVNTGPNYDQNPPSIENIFNAMREDGESFVFFGSPENFHGDGSHGKINVVFSNGFLRDCIDPHAFKQFVEMGFCRAPRFSGPFVAKSAPAEIGVGSLHSSNGVVGSFTDGLSALGPGPLEPDAHSLSAICGGRIAQSGEALTKCALSTPEMDSKGAFGHTSLIQPNELSFIKSNQMLDTGCFDRITEFIQTLTDNLIRASETPGDVGFAHSPNIQTDQLVFIERKFVTSTHVYNLQTEDEWYFANGIITHNCRHSFYPFFKGISENAYDQATLNDYAAKTVTYQGEEIDVYDATQKQRAIERKIRLCKRQAGALDAAGLSNSDEVLKVKQYQEQMRSFVKETKLDRQRSRE